MGDKPIDDGVLAALGTELGIAERIPRFSPEKSIAKVCSGPNNSPHCTALR